MTLRISVVEPPPGVPWALQLGSHQLLAPLATTPVKLTFEVPVRVGARAGGGGPRLLGAPVQGPPSARFVYLNSGRRAGEFSSGWDRRAKVPLTGLTWELIDAAQASGRPLAAAIAGRSKDGGPACASVPLLGEGWHLD